MLHRILYSPRIADAGSAVNITSFMEKLGPGPFSDAPSPAEAKEPSDGATAPDGGRGPQKPVDVDDPGAAPATPDAKAAPAPAPAPEKPKFQPKSTTKKEADKPAATPEPAKAPDKEVEEKQPRTNADWEKFKANRKKEADELRHQAETHSTRVKELEAKLAETETKLGAKPAEDPNVTAEIEALRAENKALSDKITVLDVTAHPKFQSYFQEKEGLAIEKAKRVVGSEKAAEVERILKIKDDEYRAKKLEEFEADLTPAQQFRLTIATDELENVQRERDTEIRKANEHRETLVAQKQTAVKQNMETAEKMKGQLWKETISHITHPEQGDPMWQERKDDPDWNADVAKRMDMVKGWMTGKLDPKGAVHIAFNAAAYPSLLASYRADFDSWSAEKARLEAQVASLSKATPGASQSAGTGNGAPPDDKPAVSKEKPHQFEQRFGARMAAAARELNQNR